MTILRQGRMSLIEFTLASSPKAYTILLSCLLTALMASRLPAQLIPSNSNSNSNSLPHSHSHSNSNSNSNSLPPSLRPLCLPNPCAEVDERLPRLRIGLVADPQYCDQAPFKGRQYRLSPAKLRAAIDTFNLWQVDMVVSLGDVIDGREESFRVIRPIYQGLQAPEYNVLGNHEFWRISPELKPSIRDSLGMAAAWCAMRLKGIRFVFLDGTELADYAAEAHPGLQPERDSLWEAVQGSARAKIWNGGIGREQREWLRGQLAEASYLGERAIIFCHFPIMPPDHHANLWNDGQMRDLLAEFPNVVAWVAGHFHEGNYFHHQDVHHLTLRGMVMTADSNAFAVMDIYPDRLEVHGFGREPYRRLPFREMVDCESLSYLPQAGKIPGPPAPEKEPSCLLRYFRDAMGAIRHVDEVADSASGLYQAPAALPEGVYWLRFPGSDRKDGRFVPVLRGLR